jgi:FecR-like protein
MNEDFSRDDYLWTAAGEADPEIARLEALLAPYAHRGKLPALPPRARRRSTARVVLPVLTAAASLALVVAAAWFASAARQGGAWSVQSLAGAPAVAGLPVDGPSRLAVGQTLTTDAQSRARLAVGEIGRVDVEPNSRVRLIRSRPGEHRMALDRGRIAAQIWAPPRYFFVNTPSATAIDLGCAYTLDVDASGAGVIRVTHGWVAFQYKGRESFIPQGAVCATRPGFGPGTPRFGDAPAAVEHGLPVLDFSAPSDPRRAAALAALLASARARDGLTLWHLLSRGTPDERAKVYDRLVTLVPPPPSASRDAVLRADRRALDDWWNELGLDSASWWRVWKSPWRE